MKRMSWIGIVVAVLCLYLAFQVVSFLLKLALWLAVAAALYWFLAPMFQLPWPI
jgi:hypothetical protein